MEVQHSWAFSCLHSTNIWLQPHYTPCENHPAELSHNTEPWVIIICCLNHQVLGGLLYRNKYSDKPFINFATWSKWQALVEFPARNRPCEKVMIHVVYLETQVGEWEGEKRERRQPIEREHLWLCHHDGLSLWGPSERMCKTHLKRKPRYRHR